MGSDIGPKCDVKANTLELNVFNTKVNIEIGVEKKQAKLADIVPLARTICTKICDVTIQNIISNGDQIPCCKGCSALCCRYLVPLSVPEALRLKEEITEAPTHKRELIWKECLSASRYILYKKPPNKFKHQSVAASSDKSADLNPISNWYRSLNLDCPFLHENICTIYEQRPLACREHYVTGSACKFEEKNSAIKLLEMPIHISDALGQLASELEGKDIEAVILPLALMWCEKNKQRAMRTWPYAMMVERLIDIIKKMADQNTAAFAL